MNLLILVSTRDYDLEHWIEIVCYRVTFVTRLKSLTGTAVREPAQLLAPGVLLASVAQHKDDELLALLRLHKGRIQCVRCK